MKASDWDRGYWIGYITADIFKNTWLFLFFKTVFSWYFPPQSTKINFESTDNYLMWYIINSWMSERLKQAGRKEKYLFI